MKDDIFKDKIICHMATTEEKLKNIEEKLDRVETQTTENAKKINWVYAWAAGFGVGASILWAWLQDRVKKL